MRKIELEHAAQAGEQRGYVEGGLGECEAVNKVDDSQLRAAGQPIVSREPFHGGGEDG